MVWLDNNIVLVMFMITTELSFISKKKLDRYRWLSMNYIQNMLWKTACRIGIVALRQKTIWTLSCEVGRTKNGMHLVALDLA